MADDRLDDAIDAVVRAVDRIERATRSVTGAPVAADAPVPAPSPAEPVAPEAPSSAPLASAEPVAPAPRTTEFEQPHPMVEPHAPLEAPQAPAQAEYLRGTTNFWSTVRDVPVAPQGFVQPAAPVGSPALEQAPAFGHPPTHQSFHSPAPEGSTPPAPQAPQAPAQLTFQPPAPRQVPPMPAPAFDAGAGLGPAAQATTGPAAQTTAEFSALGAATLQTYAAHSASPEVHELVGRIVGRMQSLEDHLTAAGSLRAEISELVARLAAAASKPR